MKETSRKNLLVMGIIIAVGSVIFAEKNPLLSILLLFVGLVFLKVAINNEPDISPKTKDLEKEKQ